MSFVWEIDSQRCVWRGQWAVCSINMEQSQSYISEGVREATEETDMSGLAAVVIKADVHIK